MAKGGIMGKEYPGIREGAVAIPAMGFATDEWRARAGTLHAAHPELRLIRRDGDLCGPSGRILHACHSVEQVECAIQRGHGFCSVSWADAETLARHRVAHVRASTWAVRRPDARDWCVARSVLVNPDPARAEAMVMDPDGPCYAYYQRILPMTNHPDAETLMRACVLFGTPTTVRDRLTALSQDAPFGSLALIDHDWPDATAARISHSLFAERVMPDAKAPMRHNQGKLEYA
jgi:alkanesulfonate monooxygenase SsuD/methylene tetrahydromethanopterin reductase-like flavin-dependent oxidoreductase (luciferase family)